MLDNMKKNKKQNWISKNVFEIIDNSYHLNNGLIINASKIDKAIEINLDGNLIN